MASRQTTLGSKVNLQLYPSTFYALKLNVQVESKEEFMVTNEFLGPAFRGVFGNSLRKISERYAMCNHDNSNEPSDDLRQCPYCYLFKSTKNSDSNIMSKTEVYPHPYSVFIPFLNTKSVSSGQILDFELTLIGQSISFLPLIIKSLQRALSRMPFYKTEASVSSIEYFTPAGKPQVAMKQNGTIKFPAPVFNIMTEPVQTECVTLKTISPLAIRHNGRVMTKWDHKIFLKQLFRRIWLLSRLYCDEKALPDNSKLEELLKVTSSRSFNTKTFDYTRYSTRQKQFIPLFGMMTEAEITGGVSELMPFIQAGEFISTGRHTTHGFGKYEVNYDRK